MKLLGKCPNCGTEDSVFASENLEKWNEATCRQCGQTWPRWLELTWDEKRQGNRLIPVEIEINRYGVMVSWPQMSEIPCARLIVSILNTALMVRFNLRTCFATEGGIQGIVEREPIELRNMYDRIGLSDDHHFEVNPVCQKILDWYARTLRILFEEELVFGNNNFGQGAILRLSPNDTLHEKKARDLLWLALWKKTGSRGFARAVFERMQLELASPFSGPYIAGLTDEQIIQFFVQPPLS